jgi:ELWxxDGT repeat protein
MGVPSGGEKYRLIRSVGQGGMGVVYEAWDLRLDRRVALKFLHAQFSEGPENAEQLEREARNSARIEHPNVVRVYGMETVNGQLVIEMQFIEGAPLHTILAAGRLAPGVAVDLLRQFLEALAACHSHGVIHCDLKPGNLLVTPEGQLYLTDFGISHSLRGAGVGRESEGGKGGKWGTPRYIPPEAWYGDKPDPRWDLYSAGAVIYEMLCGVPLREKTTQDTSQDLPRGEQMRSIAERVPALSPELTRLVDGLTAEDPRKRPKHAQEALALLRETPEYKQREIGQETFAAFFQSMDAAEQTTKYVSERGATGGHPARWALLGGALLAILLFVGLAYHFGKPRTAVMVNPDSSTPTASANGLERSGGAVTPEAEAKVGPTVGVPKPLDTRLVQTEQGIFYAFDDGVHGRELWTLQRGPGNMSLVEDIWPGPESSNPQHFIRRGLNDFLFSASTPACGDELWYNLMNGDGTTRDRRMIKDILPGPMGSEAYPVAVLQTTVLFDARTLFNGRELWCTNTVEEQTAMVEDISPGALDSVPGHSRVAVDSRGAYMIAFGSDGMCLWRYELESNRVYKIAAVNETAGAVSLGDKLLVLNTKDAEHGMELWVHESPQPGIRLLKDIQPGAESSDPGQYISWKGKAIFQARTTEQGMEPWITDGTLEGTFQLGDLYPGSDGSAPYGFVDAGERVFFRAHDSAHGHELWMTDGTREGTVLAADIWSGPESSTPYNIVPNESRLYFSARDDVHGEELWMLDVRDPGHTFRLVEDLWPGASSSEPISLCWWDERTGVFIAKTGPNTSQFIRIEQKGAESKLQPVALPGTPGGPPAAP